MIMRGYVVLEVPLLRRMVVSEGSRQHDALQLVLSLALHLAIWPVSLGLIRALNLRQLTTHRLTRLRIIISSTQDLYAFFSEGTYQGIASLDWGRIVVPLNKSSFFYDRKYKTTGLSTEQPKGVYN